MSFLLKDEKIQDKYYYERIEASILNERYLLINQDSRTAVLHHYTHTAAPPLKDHVAPLVTLLQ